MKYIYLLFLTLLVISCTQPKNEAPPIEVKETTAELKDSINFGCDAAYFYYDGIVGEKGGDLKTVYVNFTYVGDSLSEEEKNDLSLAYFSQMKVINAAFEPYDIQFKSYGDMVYFNEDKSYTLDQVHSYYFDKKDSIIPLFQSIDVENIINVYSFKLKDNALISGFTPTLTVTDWYEEESPQWDRLLVSHYGMENKCTLFHELMHYLHASKDIADIDIDELTLYYGINTLREKCVNLMNYSCCAFEVTDKQMHNAVNNLMTIRAYLINYE